MDEADRLCDRVAIIDHGRIIALGSPEDLKRSVSKGIIYVRLAGPEKARELAKAVREEGLADEVRRAPGGRLALFVKDAPAVIPDLFRLASRLGLSIAEVSYRMPTLDDVFLRLTGRGLREPELGPPPFVRRAMRRWRS